jgi:hypothetical protein
MLTTTLLTSSAVLVLASVWALLDGRLTRAQCSGVAAAACIPAVVAVCLDGVTIVAAVFAALGAANAWIWWNDTTHGTRARRTGATRP